MCNRGCCVEAPDPAAVDESLQDHAEREPQPASKRCDMSLACAPGAIVLSLRAAWFSFRYRHQAHPLAYTLARACTPSQGQHANSELALVVVGCTLPVQLTDRGALKHTASNDVINNAPALHCRMFILWYNYFLVCRVVLVLYHVLFHGDSQVIPGCACRQASALILPSTCTYSSTTCENRIICSCIVCKCFPGWRNSSLCWQ